MDKQSASENNQLRHKNVRNKENKTASPVMNHTSLLILFILQLFCQLAQHNLPTISQWFVSSWQPIICTDFAEISPSSNWKSCRNSFLLSSSPFQKHHQSLLKASSNDRFIGFVTMKEKRTATWIFYWDEPIHSLLVPEMTIWTIFADQSNLQDSSCCGDSPLPDFFCRPETSQTGAC